VDYFLINIYFVKAEINVAPQYSTFPPTVVHYAVRLLKISNNNKIDISDYKTQTISFSNYNSIDFM